MAAYTHNTGANVYFENLTGGSAIATLDTHAISAGSTLVVRTDTYACANHSVAVGSLDTVTYSGVGGSLKFDPTYVRVVAYTAGSGNSPAYGAAISQGGVSGVFLGCWTNWLSEPIVAGAAIGATGYMKIGGTTGGEWAAGAITGIALTCSGASVQGWMEVRGPDTATITVPRIGKVESVEAWFEIGTTNGARNQIISCPTCATNASTFPGVWIETAAGSGVYEKFASVGTVVALATHRTDASMKVITQTTGGIRIGHDGTNGVFYLPPTGCKVRIPAIILTTCTRSASGSGPRVLPNASIATRQEFDTFGGGYLDLRGIVSQWYMNFSQAFYVKYKSCAISDSMILSEIASPLDVDDCIVAPTVAQLNTALAITSCFAGGTVQNSVFNRFSLATAVNVALLNYVTGVTFSGNIYRSCTLRLSASSACISSTQAVNCTFTNETLIGGRGYFVGAQRCTFNSLTYYDHTITTTTTSTTGMYALDFAIGGSGNTVDGLLLPLPGNGPYAGLVSLNACYATLIKNIGTSYTTPLAMNNAVTGVGVNGAGNNDGITMKRVFLSGTRTGPYAFVNNSDTNILVENVSGDTADTSVVLSLNTIIKNAMLTGATTGQISVYGTHWLTRFISTTAGFAEVLCNEPTGASAAQCWASGGTPQFNSSGSVLLTQVGDQVTWEMPFFAIGYTAFTNSAPTITGTNVTFSSGSTWGNHTLEFQVDTGSGYTGWLALNAAALIANTFNSTAGFKLKIRATCLTANAGNVITNMRVALTTTQTDRDTKLYPLSVVPVTITVQDSETLAAIQNARVRLTTDVGGYVVLEGVTNASGVLTGTTEYAAHAITGTVRRATVADGARYKPGSISGTTTSVGFASTVLMISDE